MRRINSCINKQLLDLCQKTITLASLDRKVHHYLSKELQAHCTVGSFHKGSLVLLVNDAIFATSLRYCLPELRDKLRKEAGLYDLLSIKIKVNSYPPETTASSAQKINLSVRARQVLREASDLCSYEPLKEALYRLSK